MRRLFPFSLMGIAILSLTPQLQAQRPIVPGVTGTVVTEQTAKDEKKAENTAGAAINDLLPGGKTGPLSDLKAGTAVVIRHGSDVTEGVVAKVERATNQITVRYTNKKTEKMVLADRGAADARTVEYSDEANRKITRYFKLKS